MTVSENRQFTAYMNKPPLYALGSYLCLACTAFNTVQFIPIYNKFTSTDQNTRHCDMLNYLRKYLLNVMKCEIKKIHNIHTYRNN